MNAPSNAKARPVAAMVVGEAAASVATVKCALRRLDNVFARLNVRARIAVTTVAAVAAANVTTIKTVLTFSALIAFPAATVKAVVMTVAVAAAESVVSAFHAMSITNVYLRVLWLARTRPAAPMAVVEPVASARTMSSVMPSVNALSRIYVSRTAWVKTAGPMAAAVAAANVSKAPSVWIQCAPPNARRSAALSSAATMVVAVAVVSVPTACPAPLAINAAMPAPRASFSRVVLM
jgi:hypothetical protein